MNDQFDAVLDEFKAKESPEAVLIVGDEPDLIRVVLAWPNVPVWRVTEEPAFSENWSDIGKWNWLWQCVLYRKWDLESAVGITHNLDKIAKMLTANRILYPDGSVHPYATRYACRVAIGELRIGCTACGM